jgi:hypothetical protein
MEINRTTNQANRVADVSDALDSFPVAKRQVIWGMAERIYRQDDVSFLQAFEYAIAQAKEIEAR